MKTKARLTRTPQEVARLRLRPTRPAPCKLGFFYFQEEARFQDIKMQAFEIFSLEIKS